jgi:hypothetical protein
MTVSFSTNSFISLFLEEPSPLPVNYKKLFLRGELMPVILATWEAEVEGIAVRGKY